MTKGCDEARPGEATPRRVVETRPVSQTAPHLHQQFTTELPPLQAIHIADFLPRVVENAIPARYLRQLTGLSDRDLRRQIQRERLAGAPILSDNISGYFLPANDLERQQFVQSMRCRAKEIQAVAAAVEAGTSDLSLTWWRNVGDFSTK